MSLNALVNCHRDEGSSYTNVTHVLVYMSIDMYTYRYRMLLETLSMHIDRNAGIYR